MSTRGRIDRLLHYLDLADPTDKLIESYRTGMNPPLSLACTCLHDRPVVILEEPPAAPEPGTVR